MNCKPFAETSIMPDQEFTEIHRKLIGTSQIGAIAGYSDYVSPFEVYLEKIGQLPDQQEQHESALWGKLHEPTISAEFARRYKKALVNPEMIYQHNDLPYLLCTPDRFVTDSYGRWMEVVELKTASEYKATEWANDSIPARYEIQTQMQLHFFDLPKGWLVCLIGGNRLVIREIVRDDIFIHYALDIVKNFWENNVQKKVRPALMGSESEGELIASLYPKDNDLTIDLPEDADGLIVEYSRINKQLKELETQKDIISNTLKLCIGENLIGLTQKHVIKLPTISRASIDTAALKVELPEVYWKYLKQTSYRRMYTSDIKSK